MKCVLCEGSLVKIIYDTKSWKVVECRKCGLITTKRNQGEISYDFYHRDDDYKNFEKHFRNIFKKRIGMIHRFTKKHGKVLEIGCSNGTMLDIFKEFGWETWGVEPSENIEYALDKGHKVFQTTFEKLNLQEKFDLIVLNHTLEHLKNPVEVLKKAYVLLEKGGIIYVDVPNFESLLSSLLDANWPYLLPKEHDYQFTQNSLKKIFEKAGFKVIHFETRSGIFEFASPLSELKDSLFGLKKRFITSILSFPYDLLATTLNKGDSMSMIGVRK